MMLKVFQANLEAQCSATNTKKNTNKVVVQPFCKLKILTIGEEVNSFQEMFMLQQEVLPD